MTPTEPLTFPDGFVWGTAAAAHQVEGGNWANDWWAWEHAPDTICAEPSGDAIDHYHRYPDDFELLASFGHGAHRLSFEWSRIEPEPGEFSTAALDHYARVLDALERSGLTPFVTLHHFTSPRWLIPSGTWASDEIVGRFRRYAEVVARRLGGRIPFVGTINEPQIVAFWGYRGGAFPPGERDEDLAAKATRNLIAAHAAALEAFKEHAPDSQVGLVLSLTDHQAENEDAVEARDRVHRFMTGVYLDALRFGKVSGIGVDDEIEGLGGATDWVGANYYSRSVISDDGTGRPIAPPAGAETTQMGYEVYPPGFTTCLKEAATVGVPVYVTENGIGTDDDHQRVRFIARHLEAMKNAMDDGADVRGYFYWSAWDNFEWVFGYEKTFGLIAVDRETFERRPKPSAHYLGEIASNNRLDPETTARYLDRT